MIAPGQGKDMMNNLMSEVAPHARQGTSDDLGPAKGAFTGGARTLDGAQQLRALAFAAGQTPAAVAACALVGTLVR